MPGGGSGSPAMPGGSADDDGGGGVTVAVVSAAGATRLWLPSATTVAALRAALSAAPSARMGRCSLCGSCTWADCSATRTGAC